MHPKRSTPMFRYLTMLMLLILLVACSTTSPGQPGSPVTKATILPTQQVDTSTVELTLWNVFTDDAFKPYADRLTAIQPSLPGVTIKSESIPHDQYNIKVKTQAAGGMLPDIVEVWPGAELEPLVKGGVLMPIDDIAAEWKDKLIPASQLKDYAVDGKQYAIPGATQYTHLIFYNKALLSKAGYQQFPSTY